MVCLRRVYKYFESGRGRTYVLQSINLDVREGEFVTIMGPSGAGKSTLLHILGLLDGAFEGEYGLLGHAVHRMRPRERIQLGRENIGFIFQQYHLLDDLTVYENLAIPLSYRGVKPAQRAAIVAHSLDRFQIVGKRNLFPNQLSGGQQQLVAVARAVIANPKLILADEPTGNLHSEQGKEIMELFRRLNGEGTTIIQVTHSEENAAFSKRIFRLRDGWVEGDSGNDPADRGNAIKSEGADFQSTCRETHADTCSQGCTGGV
ncbi:MAG: ABC transporter ATP-binding protein [Phycisphaerales bacterium]|nr:MAG: ABC transporter ATP-binding protein [Phycisphaerales bacterium]